VTDTIITTPETATEPPRPRRRAALLFVLATATLDVLALGIIIPVFPELVVDFTGSTVNAARTLAVFGTVWAAMQFIFSPLLGALSDRFGRRPVLLLSIFGLGLDYMLMALAPSLGWLFVGRVISGITAASFTTAGAYIADVTPHEGRAKGFGLLGAAFGIGFVLGPALGGALGAVDTRLPFWVAAGLCVVNALYGLFVLPESLPRERRGAFSWRRANPLGALRLLRSHPELFGLATVAFLYYLAHEVLPSTFVLYANYRYGWTPLMVGATLAAVGVCAAIVQGGLIGPAVRAFGERRALAIGLLAGTGGFVIYGLAASPLLFWSGIPLMAVWGLAGPASQALMTHHVAPSEQGRLQGALTSVRGLTGLIGPSLFSLTFAASIEPGGFHMPGAAYLLASALLLAALLVAWHATRSRSERS
jgi:MFS transporter, DHA1 family, tetracycline resistance protein